MDDDDNSAAWAHQQELEARQREEDQLKTDPAYEKWLEQLAAQAANEQEIEQWRS